MTGRQESNIEQSSLSQSGLFTPLMDGCARPDLVLSGPRLASQGCLLGRCNTAKGFSLTVRRISFIFSHNLSVRSSWYELIDSFCFRLNPFMSVFSLFLSCFIFSSSFLVQICAVEFYFYFCLGKNQQIILILFYNFIARLQNKHRVAMLVWFWRLPVALPLWPPPNPGAGDGPGVRAALRPTGEGPSRAGATAFERFGASAGGGGLLCPAGHLQGQAGGRVQQPPQRRGRAGERPDWCRARQTGRISFIFFYLFFWSSHGKIIWCGLIYWEKIAHKTHTKGMRHLNLTIFVFGKRHNLCFKHLLGASKKA